MHIFSEVVPTGNWFSIPYFNELTTAADTDTTTLSTQTSTRSMSETEVRNTVTRPMSLQKKMNDIELASTTAAVAVRKEIKLF